MSPRIRSVDGSTDFLRVHRSVRPSSLLSTSGRGETSTVYRASHACNRDARTTLVEFENTG